MKPVFIVGCGYIGKKIAGRLSEKRREITAIVQTDESVRTLLAHGVNACRLDLDRLPVPQIDWSGAEVFYLVPPPKAGATDPRVSRCIESMSSAGKPGRVVYISTTGVYGDCGGQWIDETRPVNPVADRARRRWDAEQQWRQWSEENDVELVVIRVPGIYGAGRLPLVRLRAQKPLLEPGVAPWTNRIHADDLVTVCVQAMEKGVPGEVYNACDGHPGTMNEYFNAVADRAGLPRPPVISREDAERQLSEGMKSYMRESRRLRNTKVVQQLGVHFEYPELSVGLDAIFRDPGD